MYFYFLIKNTFCLFLFYLIQVGTLNYMPPEAIKDTSSQSGKARSKVLLQSQFNTLANNFWAYYNGTNLISTSFIDQPKRRCLVPWMYPVLHDLWENSIPEHHQSDCQTACHHWYFPQDRISWNWWEGLAGCTEGERPVSFKLSLLLPQDVMQDTTQEISLIDHI